LEPLAIAVRAVDKAELKFGQRAAVCGGGPIGLLILQSLKMSGATELTLIEPLAGAAPSPQNTGRATRSTPPRGRREGRRRNHGRAGLRRRFPTAPGSVKAVYDLPFITAKGGRLIYSAMYPNDYEMPLNLYKFCYYNELR
jgi:(R,R)-butanediol dehydrogenase/meso-butanediol dehydrogenase/diacetyl reductase/L-iditol 2-dehydrogenase